MSENGHEEITVEGAKKLLYGAAKVVVPKLKDDDQGFPPAKKIDMLEDHLILIARWRGALEEAQLYISHATRLLEDQWDQIEGYEVALKSGDNTQRAVRDAKRKMRPDLYDGIREGKWIVERLARQIRRMERDEEFTVSRGYTFITG